eukprot:295073-Chlamydomonas_euryale.AAC.3
MLSPSFHNRTKRALHASAAAPTPRRMLENRLLPRCVGTAGRASAIEPGAGRTISTQCASDTMRFGATCRAPHMRRSSRLEGACRWRPTTDLAAARSAAPRASAGTSGACTHAREVACPFPARDKRAGRSCVGCCGRIRRMARAQAVEPAAAAATAAAQGASDRSGWKPTRTARACACLELQQLLGGESCSVAPREGRCQDSRAARHDN